MGFDLTDQGERLRNQRELRFRVRWRRNNAEPRATPARALVFRALVFRGWSSLGPYCA